MGAPKEPPCFDRTHLPSQETADKLRSLVAPHVESFNFFLKDGLRQAVDDIPPYEFRLADGAPVVATADVANGGVVANQGLTVKMWYESVVIGAQTRKDDSAMKTTPRECRERALSYTAPIMAEIAYQVGTSEVVTVHRRLGDCPIMVRSSRCLLNDLSPAEMVKLKEEDSEMGGYFVIGGLERVIRLLQVPRRNHAQAITRSSFKNRGTMYSDKGVSIRCGRPDSSTATVTLHYLNTGGAMLRWAIRKQEFLVPVVIVIKALRNCTDRELYDRVLGGDAQNTWLAARLELLLRDTSNMSLYTKDQCLTYLGSRFRPIMGLPDTYKDEEVGETVINRHVLVHLQRHEDKQELLLHMLKKLYSFVQGRCRDDNADALSNQELLLPGHLFTMYMKEKLEEVLQNIKRSYLRDARSDLAKTLINVQNINHFSKTAERFGGSVGKRLCTFLSTGNLVTSTGLDLMQVSGFTVIAERINMLRYMGHFRSVHRGQFFTTMKTTTVRKLLPESWGFLCPVHTPDGSPCGLLNHMAANCHVISSPPVVPATGSSICPLDRVLVELGVSPAGAGAGDGTIILPHFFLPVLVDGKVVGGATEETIKSVVLSLRRMKVMAKPLVEPTLEIAYLHTMQGSAGSFPGLYLFTKEARMLRQVLQLESTKREWIGALEQPYLNIACIRDDIKPSTTHIELDPTNMLSLIASLTPFSDYNQSPRNMYQCQMGKQTMGTPAHCLHPHKIDNKMYRILFPQAPIVHTRRHAEYKLDNYPQGANAVVAVISYTGFDMEDAMILNKSSYERGFAHASVMKTILLDAKDLTNSSKSKLRFTNAEADKVRGPKLHEFLDSDGLPQVGAWVKEGDPLYCLVDDLTGKTTVGKHKESEKACIETVRALGREGPNKDPMGQISITIRIPRNPIIGDKFSSRHGQKGVMSILWPQEDMPFSESGMTPDVIINPHAFPSRMTIGMLIESMAGKAGALHGTFQDATPFTFHEKDRVIDHFGEQLRAAGYAYYGSEPLYSGLTGTLMHADIFIGLVYYQRLRHMVSDKSQVRATGTVNQLTKQPIKGRKNKGGVRFGEMERDSLLSHGAAFLLHDRLMNCSDRHIALVCATCGSLLSPCTHRSVIAMAGQSDGGNISRLEQKCRVCAEKGQVVQVAMPYVFRYLANELAAMGIKVSLRIKS